MTKAQQSWLSRVAESWPIFVVTSALFWAYWPSLLNLEHVWSADPRYSHGYLIPAFSLYLVWTRRRRLIEAGCQPSPSGIFLIGIGIAMHIGGAATNIDWVESTSILPLLAGLCALIRGWKSLWILWPSVAFLIFMIPLPYSVEIILGAPLQRLATDSSTIVLQAIGFPALQEGNTINLGQTKIGIVEACNGLGMLTFFLAISVGLLLIIQRTWPEKILILAGTIPIALVANVARITITGLLIELIGHGVAGFDFHDLAGFLMMPFAIVLLLIENTLLDRLFTEPVPNSDARRGRQLLAVVDKFMPQV